MPYTFPTVQAAARRAIERTEEAKAMGVDNRRYSVALYPDARLPVDRWQYGVKQELLLSDRPEGGWICDGFSWRSGKVDQ